MIKLIHFSPYVWYKIRLWIAIGVLLFIIISGGYSIYNAYVQSREMKAHERQKFEEYQQLKDQVEIKKEFAQKLSEDPEVLEHVRRESLQSVSQDELLFRFE